MHCQHVSHQFTSSPKQSPKIEVLWYYLGHLAWPLIGIFGKILSESHRFPQSKAFHPRKFHRFFSLKRKTVPVRSSSNSSADFFLQKAIPQEPQLKANCIWSLCSTIIGRSFFTKQEMAYTNGVQKWWKAKVMCIQFCFGGKVMWVNSFTPQSPYDMIRPCSSCRLPALQSSSVHHLHSKMVLIH